MRKLILSILILLFASSSVSAQIQKSFIIKNSNNKTVRAIQEGTNVEFTTGTDSSQTKVRGVLSIPDSNTLMIGSTRIGLDSITQVAVFTKGYIAEGSILLIVGAAGATGFALAVALMSDSYYHPLTLIVGVPLAILSSIVAVPSIMAGVRVFKGKRLKLNLGDTAMIEITDLSKSPKGWGLKHRIHN